MIKQFIHDMIHMTEGEKFINYWWLWLSILLVGGLVTYIFHGRSDNS